MKKTYIRNLVIISTVIGSVVITKKVIAIKKVNKKNFIPEEPCTYLRIIKQNKEIEQYQEPAYERKYTKINIR